MYRVILKPAIDFICGFILSLVTLPIITPLLILVCLESRGPAIFKQKRIGKNLKEFTIFKIRTMRHNPQNQGAYFTSSNDSRITKVGKFLRISSLDELPQIWNLMLGDMSLIGPRPDLPVQKKNYTDAQWALRHQVKPGITGLAQSILRSRGTEKQRTTLDLFYVCQVNFCLDITVIFRTVKILFKKGVQN